MYLHTIREKAQEKKEDVLSEKTFELLLGRSLLYGLLRVVTLFRCWF